MSPRLQWVDCGKGIGIVLVVFGHVLAGTHGAGILGDALFSYTYSFVYGFHMPLFFFLSGLFVERSLARGTGPYFRSKLWSVVYPYVLWSLAIGTVNIALAGQTNTAPDLARLLAIWHQPVKGFWFLYALFGCFALYWALSRLPARAHFAVALAICAAQPWIYWGPSLVDKFLAHYVFFAAGALFVRERGGGPLELQPAALALTALAFLAAEALYLALEVTPAHNREHVATTPQFLFVPALGIATFLALSARSASTALGPALAYLGRRSLAIYVVHLLATAGTRIALARGLGIDAAAVHVLVGLTAGVVFPLVLYEVAARARVTRWAGFGPA